MAQHRIKFKTVANGKGFCTVCGKPVKVMRVGLSWRCAAYEASKAKDARKRAQKAVRTPRRTVSAIKAREGKGGKLNATELKKLLRAELSQRVRERDGLRCYVCGARCEPGILAYQGQAAHLRPINSLPPAYRYDPRVCKWMCGKDHAEFDGNTGKGRKAAFQLPVWHKLQTEEPELYAWVLNLPKAVGRDRVSVVDLRERLEELRRL